MSDTILSGCVPAFAAKVTFLDVFIVEANRHSVCQLGKTLTCDLLKEHCSSYYTLDLLLMAHTLEY